MEADRLNGQRGAGVPSANTTLTAKVIASVPGSMTHRLFVYGTLAPGRPNAHMLADVPGDWEGATITGTLVPEGWGAAAGYPGIILDEHGGAVAGFLFSSDALAQHWPRLDAFEGDGYVRVLTPVTRQDGTAVDAYVYALSGRQA